MTVETAGPTRSSPALPLGDEPLRILHVYKDYAPVPGGIENHVRVLAEAQAAAGHAVSVLVCDPGGLAGTTRSNGVELIRARRLATALSMPLSVQQPLIMARRRDQLIHVHSPYPLGELSALAFRRDARLVITHHADVQRQRRALRIYAPLLMRVLRAADAIIATSPGYVEGSRWLRPRAAQCRVIPLGVDERRFTPGPPAPDGPLLFVGRLRHYKGLDVLLRALAALPARELVVVGDGPMRTSWEGLTAELGLGGRVRFLGNVPDAELPARYREAVALVLPSTNRAEAFGTVLLEAMASGLPCVSTELGTGTSWVVRDGETGHVVPPDDADALRAAIGRLLGDPAAATAMGRSGRLRVEREFTEAAMIERTLALYHELIQAERP